MMQAPATCGELVQGTLDGIPCLVSCPIDLFSTAAITLRHQTGWIGPNDAPKALHAVERGAVSLGLRERGGTLSLQSAIPRGRGYGSSTADIVAALTSLAETAGLVMDPNLVANIAVSVEPSDSTMYPGLALFDHRSASRYEDLGPAPDLAVIVLDPGGEVDTVAFNQRDTADALRRLAPDHRQAFDLLRWGLRRGDMTAVGAAASLSARLHQTILHNPLLDAAFALAEAVHACGVCRAHSGTIIGLLLDPAFGDVAGAVRYVKARAPQGVTVRRQRLVDGGARQVAPHHTRRIS